MHRDPAASACRAGLAKDLVVYLTRHEHGTRVCELHGIQAAADALGHSNVKTTSTRSSAGRPIFDAETTETNAKIAENK